MTQYKKEEANAKISKLTRIDPLAEIKNRNLVKVYNSNGNSKSQLVKLNNDDINHITEAPELVEETPYEPYEAQQRMPPSMRESTYSTKSLR